MLKWSFNRFDELSGHEVHDIFQARVGVFVLEQNCPFQDVDGADPSCWHLVGRDAQGAIAAYCRIVPPGVKYAEPSIGRVLTAPGARGSGVGRELMGEAMARTETLWPGRAIRIGAQRYLEKFYGDFGFAQCSEPYDEDGIMHIEMLRAAGENQEHA